MRLLSTLLEHPSTGERRRMTWVAAALVLAVLVGLLDLATGYELSFGLFYLAAIGLASWRAGRTSGFALAAISAGIWLLADRAAGAVYSHPLIPFWNALIRLGFFAVVAQLIATLRLAMLREQGMARIDALTGTVNRRHFLERLQRELDSSRRYDHPLTIAYVDLDNFKQVNDSLGHAEGDRVLSSVARCLLDRLRRTDIVARFGGDEFTILLPETDQKAARTAIEAVRAELLARMADQRWPVTFSIGIVTSRRGDVGVDELVSTADELMYRVKRDGRDGLAFEIVN
jgi:diguanylate cyclase (GGDEF)-like protein